MSAPDWIKVLVDGEWTSGRTLGELTDLERFFVENIARATTVAESSDPGASYDYDDYALCELDGAFYLFNTSGCSCPSPSETWSVVWVADSKTTAIARLDLEHAKRSGAYHALVVAVAKAWPGCVEVPEWKSFRGDW